MVDVDPEVLLEIQEEALREVARVVMPWTTKPTERIPFPIKIVNDLPTSAHLEFNVERGVVNITLVPRVRDPRPSVLQISPGDDYTISFEEK